VSKGSVHEALTFFDDGSRRLTEGQVTELLQGSGNAHQLTDMELRLALSDLGFGQPDHDGTIHVSVFEHWIHTGVLDLDQADRTASSLPATRRVSPLHNRSTTGKNHSSKFDVSTLEGRHQQYLAQRRRLEYDFKLVDRGRCDQHA
jgi:hypothetical protein